MRVLDPQSALLTISEVHQFLLQNPVRPPQKKIGSYEPVSSKGYQRVREDFQEYISSTVPYIAKYPPPETFVKNVVPRLRAFGLTKTEVFMMINLGLGLARGQQQPPQSVNENCDTHGDAANGAQEVAAGDNAGASGDEEQPDATEQGNVAEYIPDDTDLLAVVVEELGERFPDEEGQEQIQKIMETIREEYERANAIRASANGNVGANRHDDPMDVS